MPKISEQGLRFIKRHEGLRLQAYKDSKGVWTIGFGHTGADVKPGMVITIEQAEDLLRRDLVRFEQAVTKLVQVPLTQAQYDALVSFAYNVGTKALAISQLLKKLNRRDYLGAADEFLKWVYIKVRGPDGKFVKKKLRGLERRRAAERRIFLGITPGGRYV